MMVKLARGYACIGFALALFVDSFSSQPDSNVQAGILTLGGIGALVLAELILIRRKMEGTP